MGTIKWHKKGGGSVTPGFTHRMGEKGYKSSVSVTFSKYRGYTIGRSKYTENGKSNITYTVYSPSGRVINIIEHASIRDARQFIDRKFIKPKVIKKRYSMRSNELRGGVTYHKPKRK